MWGALRLIGWGFHAWQRLTGKPGRARSAGEKRPWGIFEDEFGQILAHVGEPGPHETVLWREYLDMGQPEDAVVLGLKLLEFERKQVPPLG